MQEPSSEDLPERTEISHQVRRAQAFWGVALLVAVLAYSFHSTIGSKSDGSTQPAETPERFAAAKPSSSNSTLPNAGLNRPPLVVFIICDGETVSEASHSGLISQDSIALKATPDRNLIIAVLQGQPTMLPPISRVFQSECFRRELEDGTFF